MSNLNPLSYKQVLGLKKGDKLICIRESVDVSSGREYLFESIAGYPYNKEYWNTGLVTENLIIDIKNCDDPIFYWRFTLAKQKVRLG